MLTPDAVYHFLNSLSKYETNDEAIKNLSMIKAFLVIIEPLVKIYTKTDLVPMTISIACKCLCCLTSHGLFAKESIGYLLKYNIFYVILKYMDYPYEKVIFNTLSLLNNILPSTKEMIDKVLDENPDLIIKLISLLKNTNKNIPLTYCSTRVKNFLKHLGLYKTY